ncbi:hypothetical protein XBLMG947_3019 [Xanthomonas bromi]|uniref:Uncharacterized protein n=1 Tax=Xanthomonas bromi TaxID=56449 RepID=A0A1C3NP95_9XANT|nr:hypothetical protein XBLMG947_3019 [Xanthomonas bromi]
MLHMQGGIGKHLVKLFYWRGSPRSGSWAPHQIPLSTAADAASPVPRIHANYRMGLLLESLNKMMVERCGEFNAGNAAAALSRCWDWP